ncbi:MAG: S1 RNA-binding domain-containing protein [Synergistaceae bacterium]|jgi:S1 RNA binding domain protein|nr:S1 RNA-binding domain-containing protein [Synergistaceae bacterium]
MVEEKTPGSPVVNIGDVLSGTVEHIAPYGAFVRLDNGQKAMIHISELSYNFVKNVGDVLTLSQQVTAKVIKIDDKGRIDLSIKALQVKEPKPVRREEDFEKKLTSFMKLSDEKIADLNNKIKDSRGGKRRTGKK